MFLVFLSFVILQRVGELLIAKRNEKWMKKQGGLEFGQQHYAWIVAVHSLFFVSFCLEVLVLQKGISPIWPVIGCMFLITQLGRISALMSLGKYWNTKIIVVPQANIVKKGPYKFLKHPNYLIVTLEFLVIPLLFQAYGTLIVFSVLNGCILFIRIPAEERALGDHTKYREEFQGTSRFLPLPFLKKI